MPHSLIYKTKRYPILILLPVVIMITVLFFSARSYYWSEPAVDEDGLFAKIVVDDVRGPTYVLLARLSHKEYFSYIAHPGLIYEVLKVPGLYLNVNRQIGNPIDR